MFKRSLEQDEDHKYCVRSRLEIAVANLGWFEYKPLQHANGIRLLTFLPTLGEDADVRRTISEYRHDQWNWTLPKALPYAAISYAWGPPHPTQTVFLDGRPFEVRQNCWEVLRAVRRQRIARYYWIDAICINQAHAKEKSTQVSMMSQIYANAQCTLACVGVDDQTDELMHQWRRLRIPTVDMWLSSAAIRDGTSMLQVDSKLC